MGYFGSFKAENYVEKYMDYDFEYTDMQFRQYEQPNKEIPQFDEQFVEEINQIGGVENVDVQKAVWAGIDFDEAVLEDFMEIKYEDSRYKADGQSYQQTVADTERGTPNAGDYGCYITTLPV